MAQKIINARAKNKRDTSSNWTANDPVLLDGEIIIVDTADGEVREKIGDGIKTYTQLPFTDEKLRNLLNNHEGDSDIHVTAEEKAAWSESDIFIATYGTTTNAEIEAALDAGKAVFLHANNSLTIVPFTRKMGTYVHLFTIATDNVKVIQYKCQNNNWSAEQLNTHASKHATGGSDPITPASIGAAPISTTTEVTLSAASWSGDSAPYTYTLTVNGVTDTSTQEIVFATSINLEQLTAGQNANIQDGGQSANTIVLKAWGEKPTVDLPIRVIMRG